MLFLRFAAVAILKVAMYIQEPVGGLSSVASRDVFDKLFCQTESAEIRLLNSYFHALATFRWLYSCWSLMSI